MTDDCPGRIPAGTLSLHVLKVAGYYRLGSCLFFEKTFLAEGVSKYIYLKCAQAEWVSFILFLSHIAHTPVTETWCARHFNVLVLADPYRLLSQCQDTGWVSHICCNFFLPSPKKEKEKKKKTQKIHVVAKSNIIPAIGISPYTHLAWCHLNNTVCCDYYILDLWSYVEIF